MSYLTTHLVSHRQKVCSLYKKALRNLEAYYHDRLLLRYHCVLMRQRFDEGAKEIDMRKAKQLLKDGEEELFHKAHPQPVKFPNSPGGVAYQREHQVPDWVLDTWHPLEKAQYPYYFARREQRKKEYFEMWDKKYGKPHPSSTSH
uniref:NADH dehydrogenase [ubiquinone] 1 beta subcomplex subunit 9 n=1 Tax=Hemiscolopendra marginata TaxID=943146 RepID=A0A646QCU7_9MYRI